MDCHKNAPWTAISRERLVLDFARDDNLGVNCGASPGKGRAEQTGVEVGESGLTAKPWNMEKG